MSYDLMVFEASTVPRKHADFMEWYGEQTSWDELHEYDDPKVTSSALRSWFEDMIDFFPMMNGPYATEDFGHPKLADYSIGKDMIYMTCAWSCAEDAYLTARELAQKHKVGFFDVSSVNGEIVFPPDKSPGNTVEPGVNEAMVGRNSGAPGKETLGSITEIRKAGVKILVEKGYIHPVQEGSYIFVYQELDANRVGFNFQLK